jgi:CheY-like chemotaxis protein
MIVSDLDMPQISGLRFIENQKKKNCKCKHVAIISARWTEQDLRLAHRLDCKTFIKSSNFEKFYTWLDEVEKSIEPTRTLCNWFQKQNAMSDN